MGILNLFGKSKKQKIFERAANELHQHLSHMLNETDLKNVMDRSVFGKRDIEERLEAALLQHQTICYRAWVGDRDNNNLEFIVCSEYLLPIIMLLRDCRNFSPKAEGRLQKEFAENMQSAQNDPEKKVHIISYHLVNLSKEKSSEWFISWLSKAFDVSESELTSISSELVKVLEKIWHESPPTVALYVS